MKVSQTYFKIRAAFLLSLFTILFFNIQSHSRAVLPNDPYLIEQWGLINKGKNYRDRLDEGQSKIIQGLRGADIGWRDSITQLEALMKKDVVVAVFDFGVDYRHPDLKDKIVRNEAECEDGFFLPAQTSPKYMKDNDNNGYANDCIGVNLTTDNPQFIKDPLDTNSHGTHIAGIIAAETNNALGITGVSSRIKILPVKVMATQVDYELSGQPKTYNNEPATATQIITEGLRYAIHRKVDVINLSLGWPLIEHNLEIQSAIRDAMSAGIVIVAAAGNNDNSTLVYPCAVEGVLCVGSAQPDNQITDSSQFGGFVDLLAPGFHILSLMPHERAFEQNLSRGYGFKTGSSQAAPFVAAAAALLKGVYPQKTTAEIVQIIRSSTRPYRSKNKFTQGGMLRLDEMLKVIQGRAPIKTTPSFKQLETLFVDGDLTINYSIPMNGPFLKSAPQFISLSPNIKVLKTQFTNHRLMIQAQALDTSKDSLWRHKVIIGQEEYWHEVRVVRRMTSINRLEIPAPPEWKSRSVGTIPVNSKYQFFGHDGFTDNYYTQELTADGLKIDIWSLDIKNKKWRLLFSKILRQKNELVSIEKVSHQGSYYYALFAHWNNDLNNALNKTTDERDSQLVEKYLCLQLSRGPYRNLSYYYWNERGDSPLFINSTHEGEIRFSNQKSHFFGQNKCREPYPDDIPYFNYLDTLIDKNKTFVEVQFKNKTILLPAFVTKGFKPVQDSTAQELRSPTQQMNAYYFILGQDDFGYYFSSRVVNNSTLLKQIESWPSSTIKHQLIPLTFNSDHKKTEALFYYGVGVQQQLLRARVLPDTHLSLEDFNQQILIQNQILPVIETVSRNSHPADLEMAFVKSNTKQSFELSVSTFHESFKNAFLQSFQLDNPSEVIIRPWGIFKDRQGYQFFFESASFLNVARMSPATAPKIYSAPIDRISFFGKLNSQLLTPVVLTRQQSRTPGIKVVNKFVSSPTVWTWVFVSDPEQPFFAPIDTTAEIPSHCLPQNVFQSREVLMYKYLCRKDNQNYYVYIPIQSYAVGR